MVAESTHDVIPISSSDDDSDCQIVKVISTPGRSKSKMRWQYHPYKLPRSRGKYRGTKKTTAPQPSEEIHDDDDQNKERTSKEYIQHSEADLTVVSGGAARNGRLLSIDQGIDPLLFGSMADHSSSNETSDAKAERSVMTGVDPTDPLANRHYTADLEPMSMLPPPSLSQKPDPSKQMVPLDNQDKQRDTRFRSCSAAILEISLEKADAQRRNIQRSERDIQEIDADTLDEHLELLLEGTANLVDCVNHLQPLANSAALPNENGSILPLESLLEESNQGTIKREEPQDDVETGLLQPYKGAITASRRRLPRVGERRAWSSIINFDAYEAMSRPLFTQQKEMIRSVTYDDMVEERAKRKVSRE